MIKIAVLEEAMFEALRLAATRLPPDVCAALQNALAEETDPLSRRHLEVSLDNGRRAEAGQGLVCADTGFPLFFITAGNNVALEGGFAALHKAASLATARATRLSFLRPTMVDPVSRKNPGENVGAGMPLIDLRFCENMDGLDIVAAPKGGGSEIFGTFYRMLYPSDGMPGVLQFVMDSVRDGCYAGKICPPAIIGVGLGGTADLCMHLAKRAALLRAVGSRHSDPALAEIEQKLLETSREMGVGPMGARGRHAVMAFHIETALTHTAALPVAVNAQCLVGRRWRALIDAGGSIAYTGALP